jgi:hypothetical protein
MKIADTVHSGNYLPTFRRKLMPPHSALKIKKQRQWMPVTNGNQTLTAKQLAKRAVNLKQTFRDMTIL